jgi:uncharacterized protein
MLLDTSGLLCLCHRGEPQHHNARDLYYSASRRVTHNYILAEFIALARVRGVPSEFALQFAAEVLDGGDIDVAWVEEPLHRAATSLLLARPDKTYSLCDAVSFLLMRELGIKQALTTDRHFEQEGFDRLLPY